MTNWSGSLTFDDKIFGNRRYEQVFWVRSWLLSDADLCIWMDIHILYMNIYATAALRLYYNVNLCMDKAYIVDVEYLLKSERNFHFDVFVRFC